MELERLQLGKARVERENIEARAKVHSAASNHTGQENVVAVTKTPGLPDFVGGKVNLNNYLEWFERNANIWGWKRDTLDV